jgi:tRNA pseudouridine synthase 10
LKKKRGISQRRGGLGLTGDQILEHSSQDSNSFTLEQAISEYLMQLTLVTKVKFSWIGGEDRESLVLGNGRPFFAEIIRPKRRIITSHHINLNEGVELIVLKTSKNLPRYGMKFVFLTRISIVAEKSVSIKELECLNSLSSCTIWFKNKKKILSKYVYSVKIDEINGKNFILEIIAEGGLHIKQFVGGKEYCEPNISTILGRKCECSSFDVMDIWLQDRNAIEVFQQPSKSNCQ